MATPRSQSLLKAIKWTRNMQKGETDQQLFNELLNFQMDQKAVIPFSSSPDHNDQLVCGQGHFKVL
jgi:hypothetical protein